MLCGVMGKKIQGNTKTFHIKFVEDMEIYQFCLDVDKSLCSACGSWLNPQKSFSI